MFHIDKILPASIRSKLLPDSSRKTRIVSAAAMALAACAFGAAGVAPLVPDASDLPVKSITQELSLPNLSEQIATLEQTGQTYVSEERVRPGDTLAALLNRLGVDDSAAASFIKSDTVARGILQLKVGKRIQAQTADDGQLQWLSTTVVDARDSNQIKTIVVTRTDDQFNAFESSGKFETRIEMRTGEIKSSLFAATDVAQIPDNIASQIVDLFSTDIDFGSDLQRGDRFNVVYQTFWQNGEFVRAGRVLASEFKNGNRRLQSVWFDEPDSKQGGGYYGFDGKSLKKAFLKSPLEFSRISSGFSMRSHPISGQWKQHKGVDFAAPTGTPIRASGDGVVHFLGTQGGYGNVVVLKHWSNYTTAYAHMNNFASGLRQGMKVNQGEVIGYVGTTGWSTGPHLHYEFRVDNEPHDPMAIDIPNAQPLAGAQLQRFREVSGEMAHRFALLTPQDMGFKLASR